MPAVLLTPCDLSVAFLRNTFYCCCMVRDEDVYPIDTVVRLKKTNEFAMIKHQVFRKWGKLFMHYLGKIDGRENSEGGFWAFNHEDVELEALPLERVPNYFYLDQAFGKKAATHIVHPSKHPSNQDPEQLLELAREMAKTIYKLTGGELTGELFKFSVVDKQTITSLAEIIRDRSGDPFLHAIVNSVFDSQSVDTTVSDLKAYNAG